MKKITIFSLFLLILSFSVLFFPTATYAKLDNYKISIACDVYNIQQDAWSYSDANKKFVVDYSAIANTGSITFTATAVSSLETPENDQITYQWLNRDRKVVSESDKLTLYKSISEVDLNRQLIKTNNTTNQSSYQSMYVLVVSNKAKNQKEEVSITISVTDQNQTLKMQSLSSGIPAFVYNMSENITFYATVPTLALTEVNWLAKKPNGTSFDLISSGNKFEFTPNTMATQEIGYGQYKIIAVCKTNTKTYYSETYTINTSPSPKNFEEYYKGAGSRLIISKKVDNSKAKIEAFKYTLSDTADMNYSNIHWYIGGERVAVGNSFIYEPTSTDKYKVSVRYLDPGTHILSPIIDSHEESPQPTDTYILILIIVCSVFVLSGILAISIIVTNKKRDVVW